MRYLAIDYGEKRTGLAVGDDVPGLATPLSVIEASSSDERMRHLEEAIRAQGPDALVLGLPLNVDGTDGPAARKMRAFAGKLREQFGLPVHLADERFSSEVAEERMNQAGWRGRQKKARVDAMAAATILSDFFTVNQRPPPDPRA